MWSSTHILAVSIGELTATGSKPGDGARSAERIILRPTVGDFASSCSDARGTILLNSHFGVFRSRARDDPDWLGGAERQFTLRDTAGF
jgi:hypothetical protein